MKPLLLLLSLWAAANVMAAPISYNVTVNTAGVSGAAGNLYFQFNPGDFTSDAALVTVDQFHQIGMGSLSGSPSPSGDSSGNLLSALILRNTASNNDALQALTFSNSIQFRLTFSGTLLDSPSTTAITGSVFNFGLFGADGVTPFLTTNPDGYALTVNLDTHGAATSSVYPASANAGPVVSISAISAVPEPASVWLMATAALVLVGCKYRRGLINIGALSKPSQFPS